MLTYAPNMLFSRKFTTSRFYTDKLHNRDSNNFSVAPTCHPQVSSTVSTSEYTGNIVLYVLSEVGIFRNETPRFHPLSSYFFIPIDLTGT